MTDWLALARARVGAELVPKCPKSPKCADQDDFGDFGNFGTQSAVGREAADGASPPQNEGGSASPVTGKALTQTTDGCGEEPRPRSASPADLVPNVPKSPKRGVPSHFGDFDNFATESRTPSEAPQVLESLGSEGRPLPVESARKLPGDGNALPGIGGALDPSLPRATPVPKSPKSPKFGGEGNFGDSGQFGTGVPIPVEAVRAAYEAIFERLTIDHARPPEAARTDALDHLRVELRRDARLLPSQPDPLRCAVCGEGERSWRPLVAVCTGMPDEYRWLHGGECHEGYRARLTALVDATLASAGLIEPAPLPEAAE